MPKRRESQRKTVDGCTIRRPDDPSWSTIEELLLVRLTAKQLSYSKQAALVNKIMEDWYDPTKGRPTDHRTAQSVSTKARRIKIRGHDKGATETQILASLKDHISQLEEVLNEDAIGKQDLKVLESAIECEMMTMREKSPNWPTLDEKVELPPEFRGYEDPDTKAFVLWPWQGSWSVEGPGLPTDDSRWRYSLGKLSQREEEDLKEFLGKTSAEEARAQEVEEERRKEEEIVRKTQELLREKIGVEYREVKIKTEDMANDDLVLVGDEATPKRQARPRNNTIKKETPDQKVRMTGDMVVKKTPSKSTNKGEDAKRSLPKKRTSKTDNAQKGGTAKKPTPKKTPVKPKKEADVAQNEWTEKGKWWLKLSPGT